MTESLSSENQVTQCNYCGKDIDTAEESFVEMIDHPGQDRVYCDHPHVYKDLDGGFDE